MFCKWLAWVCPHVQAGELECISNYNTNAMALTTRGGVAPQKFMYHGHRSLTVAAP